MKNTICFIRNTAIAIIAILVYLVLGSTPAYSSPDNDPKETTAISAQAGTMPAGTSITLTPSPMGSSLGRPGGVVFSYHHDNWPECVNWGLHFQQNTLNLDNPYPPNFDCIFQNLTFSSANPETVLGLGRACFTGTQAYYCRDIGGNLVYRNTSVRMRVVVTEADGVTPIPLVLIGNYIVSEITADFKVRVFIEADASQLWNLSWIGTNYYSIGGWHGVISIYDALNTVPGRSLCTGFNEESFVNVTNNMSATSNSPVFPNETIELYGSSELGCCYHWIGPNNFTSELQNPVIANAQAENYGTYKLYISNGLVCFGSATTNVIMSEGYYVAASPASSTVCSGGTQLLQVTALGNGYTFTYQWEYFLNGSWRIIPGQTGTSYLARPPYTRSYRVVVMATNEFGTIKVISNPAVVTVVPDPTITQHPADRNICTGGEHTMTVVATGGTPELLYQWYTSPDGSNWLPMEGENANTLHVSNLVLTAWFRCEVSAAGNGCDAVTSNAAVVTIYADPQITIAADQEFCVGGTAYLTSSANGGCGVRTWQWQFLDVDFWRDLDGEVSKNLSISPETTTQYRCLYMAAGNDCNTGISNVVTVTVHADPHITQQPQGGNVSMAGDEFELSVTAQGGMGLMYQWQYFHNEVWLEVPGATQSSFITRPPYTRQYRVKITSAGIACSYVISEIATVVVGLEKSPDNQPENDDRHAVAGPMLHVYPNPFDDEIQIEVSRLEAGELTIDIFDVFGRKIHTRKANTQTEIYNTSFGIGRLAAGMYLIRISAPNGSVVKRVEKN